MIIKSNDAVNSIVDNKLLIAAVLNDINKQLTKGKLNESPFIEKYKTIFLCRRKQVIHSSKLP